MLNTDPISGQDAYQRPSGDQGRGNPFPGLRPFGVEESDLYFGRSVQVDDVIQKLNVHRFVAILGYSGSGKSSLVRAGLIPTLRKRSLEGEWQIMVTRPGTMPVANLAEVLLGAPESASNLSVSHTNIIRQLTDSPTALADIIEKIRQKPAKKTLLIVDQFEELFHYQAHSGNTEEVEHYVELLLNAIQRESSPVYLAITMRSDQIGYSARYDGLTNIINQSNYLIPQMTVSEKREAIEGPVRSSDGTISDKLVDQLLTDLGRTQDQLPVLQHALMRTWDYWTSTREEDEPLDLRHYHAVGGVQEALSLHANEAFEELDTAQKEIAETLFKSLTEKGKDNIGIRRAATVGSIVNQTEYSEEEVIEVIEKFREQSRSFLMPPPFVQLTSETQVEISHESLMRIWDRLKFWVEEEYESAQMYVRLSEAAAMYQMGQTGLWRPPELQLALNWQKKQKPTYEWARRYDEAFERAMVFLDTSRITFEAEQKQAEVYQRKVLRRTRGLAMLFGFLAVIAILFFIFAAIQWGEADKAKEAAQTNAELAQQEAQRAEEQRARAVENEQEALHQQEIARQNAEQARKNFLYAEEQREIAELQAQIAENERNIATTQRIAAEEARQDALVQYQRAEEQYQRANELLYRSVAQSMAVKAVNVEDNNLKGLLAQHAYDFNSNYGGKRYDPYIYNGLFDALRAFKGVGFNVLEGNMRNSARSLAVSSDGTTLFATGSQGKVVMTGTASGDNPVVLHMNRYPNRVLRMTANERYLLVGSDSASIQVIDLNQMGSEPSRIPGHTSFVNDIHLIDNVTFYSVGGDGQLRRNDLRNMQSESIARTEEELKTIDLSPDGRYVYGGTVSGNVYRIDVRTGKAELFSKFPGSPIHAVQVSPDGRLVTVGDEKGLLHILNPSDGAIVRELRMHKARISDLEFSRNGELLASSSLDGGLVLWETDKWNEIPIELTDNDSYVWDMTFSPGGDYVYAACGDGNLRIWPTRPELMAGELCRMLGRNMTAEEWEAYVGNGIPIMETCKPGGTE